MFELQDHHRLDFKNSNRKPQYGKMATGERQNMMEKKRKVEKMARCMVAGEIATFTIGQYVMFVR